MSKDLGRLCRQLGLAFRNLERLREALTHRSAGPRNNERLEFLGDAALGFIVAQELFHRFPRAREGELSRMRASLVNQTSLAQLARRLNLGDWLVLGPGELKSGGFRRDSILSDALEALIGAIVEDQGIDVCRRWVVRLFAESFSRLEAGHWGKDAKTRLQEFLQGRGLPLPRYELISQSGPPHQQTFVVACHVAPLPQPFVAEGGARKQAEQRAAAMALERLTQASAKQS